MLYINRNISVIKNFIQIDHLWSFIYMIYTIFFGNLYRLYRKKNDQKCIDYLEKWSFMVIFLNYLYSFMDTTQLFS